MKGSNNAAPEVGTECQLVHVSLCLQMHLQTDI